MRKDQYQSRLDELGWSRYRLVKEVVTLRQSRGDKDCTFKRIQTSIYECLKNPDDWAASINDDVVVAMGGAIVIEWADKEAFAPCKKEDE